MLIDDLDVRIIHATTGETIRTLTINPNRRYHGTGATHRRTQRTRRNRKTNRPNHDAGPGLHDV